MSDDTKILEPGALENILIGAYDAFVEENARIRTKAGLTETITREAIGGCCVGALSWPEHIDTAKGRNKYIRSVITALVW